MKFKSAVVMLVLACMAAQAAGWWSWSWGGGHRRHTVTVRPTRIRYIWTFKNGKRIPVLNKEYPKEPCLKWAAVDLPAGEEDPCPYLCKECPPVGKDCPDCLPDMCQCVKYKE